LSESGGETQNGINLFKGFDEDMAESKDPDDPKPLIWSRDQRRATFSCNGSRSAKQEQPITAAIFALEIFYAREFAFLIANQGVARRHRPRCSQKIVGPDGLPGLLETSMNQPPGRIRWRFEMAAFPTHQVWPPDEPRGAFLDDTVA